MGKKFHLPLIIGIYVGIQMQIVNYLIDIING